MILKTSQFSILQLAPATFSLINSPQRCSSSITTRSSTPTDRILTITLTVDAVIFYIQTAPSHTPSLHYIRARIPAPSVRRISPAERQEHATTRHNWHKTRPGHSTQASHASYTHRNTLKRAAKPKPGTYLASTPKSTVPYLARPHAPCSFGLTPSRSAPSKHKSQARDEPKLLF